MLNKKLSKKIIFIIFILSLFKPTWLLNNESLSVGSDDMSYWLHASTVAFDYDLTYIDDFNFDHANYHPVTNAPFHSPEVVMQLLFLLRFLVFLMTKIA